MSSEEARFGTEQKNMTYLAAAATLVGASAHNKNSQLSFVLGPRFPCTYTAFGCVTTGVEKVRIWRDERCGLELTDTCEWHRRKTRKWTFGVTFFHQCVGNVRAPSDSSSAYTGFNRNWGHITSSWASFFCPLTAVIRVCILCGIFWRPIPLGLTEGTAATGKCSPHDPHPRVNRL